MDKAERVRDPVHDLIVFREDDDTDQIAWRLINTPEFQRLRRIRQLGFSDLVYPGATHSRLAHSVGVFHTARRLVDVISRKRTGGRDKPRERIVLLGALLHDIGHGPFSHAFEHALGKTGHDHEQWGADIITGDTGVNAVLREVDAQLPGEIANLLREEQAKDIYGAVVSSQFDADRLDYMQRDRLMTGVEFGHLDVEWIFDCLEVGTVTLGDPSDPVVEPCLYLSPKGMQVAEEYLEARFRLYMMVYMHKTTRAAEVMFRRLLELLQSVARSDAKLRKRNPLAAYVAAREPTLQQYLSLDDTVVWADLNALRSCSNAEIAELAARLVERRLYKCFDLGAAVGETDTGNRRQRFMRRVKDLRDSEGKFPKLLTDDPQISGYVWYDFESDSAFDKVWVKRERHDVEPGDIAQFSDIVKTLVKRARIYRLYVPSKEEANQIDQLFKGMPT
jgi:uncharacterized protein